MPNGQQPIITKSAQPFDILPKVYLFGVLILVFALLFGMGFLVAKSGEKVPIPPKDRDPILKILQNPIFHDWSGHVEGRLVDKDDSSFTVSAIIKQIDTKDSATPSVIIKDEGNKTLKIGYVKDKTIFQKVTIEENALKTSSLDYSQIVIGSIINGNVEFNKLNGSWQAIAGTNFTIEQ
ncbi:hypothetical protein HYT18_00445 [Candidatus Microgenomates bacterium]|nr:hypothetical protein [Candidatus Microgenomates bacterium]